MRFLLAVLVIAGCTVAPERFAELTPADCRAYGVAVADGDVVTGKIVHSEFGTYAKMERECLGGPSYTSLVAGCAKAADMPVLIFPSPVGEYEVYYSEHKCVSFHEACHALYEEKKHTHQFIMRQLQGDWLAACPVIKEENNGYSS